MSGSYDCYKDNLRLRTINANLRKQLDAYEERAYLTKWRASVEKELLRRDHAIAAEKRRNQKLLERWQYAVRYNNSMSGRDASKKIQDLRDKNLQLQKQIDCLQAELQEAREIIAKLTAQINHNFENSSIPSSDKPFHKSIKNSRQKTDRKPGAQKGHSAHRRPHMEPTEEPIMIPVPEKILSDPDYYLTGRIISKQVLELQISTSVKEYRTAEYRSKSTGKRGHAPFPEHVDNEFNYGPNVKSLAFLLNNYCNVSIDKTIEIISGMTDGIICLSKGMVNQLSEQFSAATAEQRRHLFSMIHSAPVMHSDASPARINGKCAQVIFCGNENEVLYCFRDHKGHKGITDTPVADYGHTLVHDHDVTYYSYGSDHQECLAHVLRYLEDSIENESSLTWNRSMKALLDETIHLVKEQSTSLSDSAITAIEEQYDSIIRTADTEYAGGLPRKYYSAGFNLMVRMRDYKHNHLLFLHDPKIPYTNNLAERELRKFKRKQKQAVTFRSRKSVEFLCNCLSIIETGRLRGYNIYLTTRNAFS